MNPGTIDLIIVIFVAAMALGGLWVGAMRSLIGIACIALVVALMVLGYQPLARLLGRFAPLPAALALLLAFALLACLGQALAVIAVQRPLGPLVRAIRSQRPLRLLDHLAGLIPGGVTGGIVAGLLLAPVAVALPGLGLGPAVREARLASPLLEANARLLQQARVRTLLQTAADTLTLPTPFAATETGRELPFRVVAADLVADPGAEVQLLALVNEERARAGLGPLAPDPALVPVARAHATEMFVDGYFAHDSPRTGDPFDRLDAAGITYLAAGENLAFAPDLLTAHRGLMDSPGHRANILSPDFGRGGFGIMRSRYHGIMVVQLFRD